MTILDRIIRAKGEKRNRNISASVILLSENEVEELKNELKKGAETTFSGEVDKILGMNIITDENQIIRL